VRAFALRYLSWGHPPFGHFHKTDMARCPTRVRYALDYVANGGGRQTTYGVGLNWYPNYT